MKNLIIIALIFGGFVYLKNQEKVTEIPDKTAETTKTERYVSPYANMPTIEKSNSSSSSSSKSSTNSCDGRTHCSQMKSCAEATYYLNNCPNTQMDGDNDGIPCEKQWC